MSLFGALQSGISGLAAQSTAMGAISDNISNVNTIGYKNNSVAFQTLVTKQTSSSHYSPGGVQPVSKQGINAQGLLAANSSSTAMGISGNGYFVVNTSANPAEGDMWAYTRAGDFDIDNQGYLKNTSGFYLQGWSLLPWDGNSNANIVDVNGVKYMKAYYDSNGDTVYINDNIVDNRNLRPINLSTIGGSATPTQQINYGANLPANDPVYDPSVPSAGGRHSVNALIYDSLGNSSNMSLTYTKESSNSWGMSASIPKGAATVTLSGNYETFGDESNDVYYAAGQLEFTDVPAEGSYITITDDTTKEEYKFVFTSNPGGVTDPGSYAVDISTGIVSASDFAQKFAEKIQDVMPGAKRFTASGNSIQIVQSLTGGALSIDCSKTLACVQSAVNPVQETGIPTGQFTIPAIDNDIKNVGSVTFTSNDKNDYVGKSVTVNGKQYTFSNGGGGVDISGATSAAEIASALADAIRKDIDEPDRVSANGSTLEFIPSTTGPDMTLDFSKVGNIVGTARDGDSWVNMAGQAVTIKNTFNTNNTDVEQGSVVPSVRFNQDGTPKYFFVNDLQIEWANGAENMNNGYKQGTSISLSMGNVGTNDGLTSLSGNFTTNYINQDGAKFGSYAGVSIGEDGVVTALYDNGETRPIAILPLATFANANGMSSLTGNAWIETDSSGQALLKMAGTNGAGTVASSALEQSTVDLATEFSNMIVTQRAYSAATKIITTADEMLDELTRLT